MKRQPDLSCTKIQTKVTGARTRHTLFSMLATVSIAVTANMALASNAVAAQNMEGPTVGPCESGYGPWGEQTICDPPKDGSAGGSGGTGNGGSNPDNPPHGSGGAPPPTYGVPLSELSQSSISEKLDCALSNYTKPEASPKKGFVKVNGYAYVKHAPSGSVYKFTKTWVDPSVLGAGWGVVGGTTHTSLSYASSIYQYAYNSEKKKVGLEYKLPPNQYGPPLSGTIWTNALTPFEVELLISAHEAAHQNGIALSGSHSQEKFANWYGYAAVLAYKEDHGAKCN